LAQQPLERILFSTFEHYPLALPMSIAAILLLIVFFVTSADSATFVLGMQSEGGNMNPSTPVKIIWGVLVSTIAIVLLRAGGLSALQNVLIITALPFSILLLLITASLIKELNYERRKMGLFLKARRHPEKDAPFRSYEKDNK
ncbi:MAG: BCCT family transporter, partial [Lachnospiraceae bacterium]|nr:BCCT family transporter [Lachnospiraceae bacterium]